LGVSWLNKEVEMNWWKFAGWSVFVLVGWVEVLYWWAWLMERWL